MKDLNLEEKESQSLLEDASNEVDEFVSKLEKVKIDK
jgi:hypothetical protein